MAALMFSSFCGGKSGNDADNAPTLAVKYVLSDNGLNLRAGPSVKTRVATVVPYGAKLEITKQAQEKVKIGNAEGRWVRVRAGQRSGWVFDAFLGTEKPPALASKPKAPADEELYQLMEVDPTAASKAFGVAGGSFSLGKGCSGSSFSEYGQNLTFKTNGTVLSESFVEMNEEKRTGTYKVDGKKVTATYTEEVKKSMVYPEDGPINDETGMPEGKPKIETNKINETVVYIMVDCKGTHALQSEDGGGAFVSR